MFFVLYQSPHGENTVNQFATHRAPGSAAMQPDVWADELTDQPSQNRQANKTIPVLPHLTPRGKSHQQKSINRAIAVRSPSMLLNFLRLDKSKVVVPEITRATEELKFRMRHWFAVRQFKFDKFECRDHIRQLKEFITFRRNCLCEFDYKTGTWLIQRQARQLESADHATQGKRCNTANFHPGAESARTHLRKHSMSHLP